MDKKHLIDILNKRKEYKRAYRLRNKEKISQHNKEYMSEYLKRPEVKKRIAEYLKNPEVKKRLKIQQKEYRRQNFLNVKGKSVKVNKRPRPDDVCEVCNKEVEKLDYHHWDDDHPEQGIWVCLSCHRVVEGTDKGISFKYIRLKEAIVRELRKDKQDG